MCPVQVKVTESSSKIAPENTKTEKGGVPETKQAGGKQEEVTPYFDIQNGKITSLFSEPEIISTDSENQKTVKDPPHKEKFTLFSRVIRLMELP